MSNPESARFADDAHRYALVSRLATGGMGEVWRGRDTTLDRPVAIKLLKAEYADDTTFRRRFENEAQHAASLHHHGIASVFDFGEATASDGGIDGSAAPRPYLVMELVEGQPLSALLRPDTPLDVEVVRDLMAQTADALGVAHRAGIVHRDIKPGNLIVTPDRRIKVTDFGIARAADGLALTETGQVMGTPAYLSPEQAEGGSATAASDVYSLACVAFECLTGRRPFVADTAVAVAVAHLRQPVPTLPSSVPSDLAAVVTRALAKDPAARYADGSAFAAALRSPSSVAAAPYPSPSVGPATVPQAEAGAQPPAETQVLPTVTSSPPTGPQKASVLPWFLLGAVLVASALIIWQIVGGTDDTDNQPSDTPSTSETRTQTESPSEATETPAEESVEVDEDDYLGRDVQDVRTALQGLGLEVSIDQLDNPGDETENTVDGVNPSGTLVAGDQVTVTYWGSAPKETETPTPTPTQTPTPPPSETPTTPPTEVPTDTTLPSESPAQ